MLVEKFGVVPNVYASKVKQYEENFLIDKPNLINIIPVGLKSDTCSRILDYHDYYTSYGNSYIGLIKNSDGNYVPNISASCREILFSMYNIFANVPNKDFQDFSICFLSKKQVIFFIERFFNEIETILEIEDCYKTSFLNIDINIEDFSKHDVICLCKSYDYIKSFIVDKLSFTENSRMKDSRGSITKACKVSPFWIYCPLRFSLFTALLKTCILYIFRNYPSSTEEYFENKLNSLFNKDKEEQISSVVRFLSKATNPDVEEDDRYAYNSYFHTKECQKALTFFLSKRYNYQYPETGIFGTQWQSFCHNHTTQIDSFFEISK